MKIRQARGSVLFATLSFIILTSILAMSVLELSLHTYKLSMRNQLRAQARAVAESELEHIYYQFQSVVIAGTAGIDAPTVLTAVCDEGDTPTTVRDAFLEEHRTAFNGEGWVVRRSLRKAVNAPVFGQIPDTTKIGRYTYLIARVEVAPPASSQFSGSLTVRVGRRIMNSSTNVFQYSIFFQGDLELNPGSDVTINGDIVVNGNVYMGPRIDLVPPAQLVITDRIRYLSDHYFNQRPDGSAVYSNPNAPTPPVTLGPPTYDTTKVETMAQAENLLGIIDPEVTAKDRPDLFGPPGRTDPTLWTAAELAEAENNVHRSLLAPPPSAAGSSEYPNGSGSTPDDTVISVRRAYNKAGLIVTIEPGGAISVKKVIDGVATDVSGAYSSIVAGTSTLYDQREGKNVTTTELDVGALKATLEGAGAFDFNGLLYVNVKGSSASAPQAVRLINATSVPENNGVGFSVATNAGLYVKGNYNTTQITDAEGTRNVPAMLMADAITVLSEDWVDSNAGSPTSTWSKDVNGTPVTMTGGSALSTRVAGHDAVINAGLLTGNRSSTGTSSSGGAQNLVRYLEDWSGRSVAVHGSLGRLFQSTQYTGAFGGAGTVYLQPNRVFDFDEDLPRHNPPGSPETTAFSRGSFFSY